MIGIEQGNHVRSRQTDNKALGQYAGFLHLFAH